MAKPKSLKQNERTPRTGKPQTLKTKKKQIKHKKHFTKKPKDKLPNKNVSKLPAQKASDKKEDTSNKRKLDHDDVKEIKKKKTEKSELVTKLMGIYEVLRRKDSTAPERAKLIDEVIAIAEKKENEIALKHGTVRVLEMSVKYGNDKQRDKIFQIFTANLVTLLTSKYAKFLVEKFIEYGSKSQRNKIIEAFYGKVKKLIKNKDAQSILEEIYCKHANSSQRAKLVEEFYGPEFAVFKVASGRSLDDILTNETTKKETIIKYMKETLSAICQKDAVALSVIHKALLDYFKYADASQKTELVEVLKSAILNILHTKDGAKVAINCLWHASTKERKSIVKSFKTHVKKICMEEFGHLVMFALFDVMDDTVLLKKALFPEIISNIDDLLTNQYGRKVLLYLLKPRATTCFLPETVKFLQQGDDNAYSKKDSKVRQQELTDILLPDLLECMTKNVKDIIRNKSHAVTLLAALDVSKDLPDAIALMEAIVSLVAKPLNNDDDNDDAIEDVDEDDDDGNDVKKAPKQQHLIIDACGHWVIKNLIKQDKQRVEKGNERIFSKILCENVPVGHFADWALHNRGAFVLVSLMESNIESVMRRVREDLKFINTEHSQDEKNKGMLILQKLL